MLPSESQICNEPFAFRISSLQSTILVQEEDT
jgi:hypothetical protein